MAATGHEKVKDILCFHQGQGKVREFGKWSGNFNKIPEVKEFRGNLTLYNQIHHRPGHL